MASKFRGHLQPVVADDLVRVKEQIPLSSDEIRDALVRGRGDVVSAAYALGVDPLYLNRCIKASPAISAFAVSVERVRHDPDWQRISDEAFAARIAEVQLPYKLDSLETLHSMTVMDFDSAAMAKVKLDAAVALNNAVRPNVSQVGGADLDEMNRLYHEHAPRIKEIRERVVTFTASTEPLLLSDASSQTFDDASGADLL